MFSKIQKKLATREEKITNISAAILLIVLGFFGGYWIASVKREVPIVFQSQNESQKILNEQDLNRLLSSPSPSLAVETSNVGQTSGKFAASINGKKYYAEFCRSEISRIKQSNLIWFQSEAEAIKAGYSAAACMNK